ncbi:MAG: DUF3806 domain-containing protein [Candidatus Phosphoribacter sp.]
MGLFSRRSVPGEPTTGGAAQPPLQTEPADKDLVADDTFVVPRALELRPSDRAERDRALSDLHAAGVDLDSIEAIGAGHDLDCSSWVAAGGLRGGGDQSDAVTRWGVAIGEWLVRHTDLQWATVSDAFGTDLGLVAETDHFMLVPANLVSGRWLNGQTGWVPGVAGHLARLRADR